MTLREQRVLFTRLICEFGVWAFQNGYNLAFGEVVRTKAQAVANSTSGAGISNSLHLDGLAVDFNMYLDLDRDGTEDDYVTDSALHKPLGEKWKSMHPLNRWGGDFKKPDGNHYSSTRGGVQ
jgi:hypothetical protein